MDLRYTEIKQAIGRWGWRFYSLSAACILLAFGLGRPSVEWAKPVYRYLFVIDITQSMNARDYHLEGLPADRLGFTKAAIRQALHALPCGSEVGVGLFTTRNSQVLFEPLEICQHFPLIADVLEHIDWRMAWAADSYITRGVYTGLREAIARGKDTRLVFFSDGQQFPPEPEPPFDGEPGEPGGLIVGVGGSQPVPIPRLDKNGNPQGFWEYVDLRDWLPPAEMPLETSNYYLSRLDEAALRHIADVTGMAYHRLEAPEGLSKALLDKNLAAARVVEMDIRPILALLSLVLLVMAYINPFVYIAKSRLVYRLYKAKRSKGSAV
jgi:mxaL protein